MKKLYGLVAAISTLVAALVASSACYIFIYQPEEPASLRNE
ncbi:MAG TPA: cyclic lactone autoinducer peptide [Candidatus Limiplasma sp.]|mgnify:FL=1|nr:cyclic lactone autoinducer peptide [Candidatus Limiplasma sp.]HPS80627.1 cyclic lactone autoinducer peptide [Candidatus Limiplasma sp.]